MAINNSTSSKSIWPIVAFYLLFVLAGILGMILAPKGEIINSFDFIIYGCYYFVVPIGTIISILFMQVVYPHPEFIKQHSAIKAVLHILSIILIAWGIFGILHFVNKLPSKSQPYVMKGNIISLYKKLPSSGNVKRTYHKTRYFIKLEEIKTEQKYDFQISENLYDSLDSIQRTPIIIDDIENNNVEIKNNTQAILNLKMGCLGLIY
jgi:hypothetical protein